MGQDEKTSKMHYQPNTPTTEIEFTLSFIINNFPEFFQLTKCMQLLSSQPMCLRSEVIWKVSCKVMKVTLS